MVDIFYFTHKVTIDQNSFTSISLSTKVDSDFLLISLLPFVRKGEPSPSLVFSYILNVIYVYLPFYDFVSYPNLCDFQPVLFVIHSILPAYTRGKSVGPFFFNTMVQQERHCIYLVLLFLMGFRRSWRIHSTRCHSFLLILIDWLLMRSNMGRFSDNRPLASIILHLGELKTWMR